MFLHSKQASNVKDRVREEKQGQQESSRFQTLDSVITILQKRNLQVNLPVTLSHRELQTFFLKESESFLLSWGYLGLQSEIKSEISISISIIWHHANKIDINFKM